jgi:hypothetical protein
MQINISTIQEDGQFFSTATSVNHNGKSSNILPSKKPVADVKVIRELMGSFPNPDSGLLNIGLRYISPDRKIIAFEQPPRYIDMIYTGMGGTDAERHKGSKGTMYQIPVPWMVYVAYLDNDCSPLNIYAFTLRHQLKSLDDSIHMLPLTNFYQDGRLCRAPQDDNETSFPKTLAGGMAATFYAVWMTGFNADLLSVLVNARGHGTPKFLKQSPSGKDGDKILDHWSRQTFDTVASSQFPSAGWSTLREFLASDAIGRDWAVDPTSYFVNRVHSALQNAAL